MSGLVEAALDVAGHAGLADRLERPEAVRALSVLAAGPSPLEEAIPFVRAALRRGLDEARLDLALERGDRLRVGTRLVVLGGRAPGQVIPLRPEGRTGPRRARDAAVLSLPREEPVIDGERLAATVMAASRRLPEPVQAALGEPGFGPRVGRALSLLAEWVVTGALPDPDRGVFALGSMSGEPFGVPLQVYDRVLDVVESVLFQGPRDASRVAPLVAVWVETRSHLGSLAPADPDRLAAKERKRASDLGAASRLAPPANVPALARRPRRRALRLEGRFEPPPLALKALAALDGQGDLFGP